MPNDRNIALDKNDSALIYVFIENESGWIQGDANTLINNYYFVSNRNNDSFVYTSRNNWERCKRYNDPTYTSNFELYELLDSFDKERNFAIYESDSNLASIITKRGGLDISREALVELGLGSLIPGEATHYIGYRYFIKNGKYCVMMQDDNGNVSIHELANEPVLESYDSNTEKLTFKKLISLIQISVNNTYYYVNFEKVIASGSQQSLNNDSYLALAIYTSKAPDFGQIVG